MFKPFRKTEFEPLLFSLGASAFLTSLVSVIIAFSVIAFFAAVEEKLSIDRGHELVKQSCYSYGCHSFRFKKADPEAPRGIQGMQIDTSQFSEEKLRYRMENPPSNTDQIYNKKDQDAVILYLRSQE